MIIQNQAPKYHVIMGLIAIAIGGCLSHSPKSTVESTQSVIQEAPSKHPVINDSSNNSSTHSKTDVTIAQQKAQEWLDRLGTKGLVLEPTFAQAKILPVPGSQNIILFLDETGYQISLGFTSPISSTSSEDELTKKFNYISIDKTPTPNLNVPGWRFRPITPVSSFKEGVQFRINPDRSLNIDVTTDAFMLHGMKITEEPLPADASIPKDQVVAITQTFPIRLRARIQSIQSPMSQKENHDRQKS